MEKRQKTNNNLIFLANISNITTRVLNTPLLKENSVSNEALTILVLRFIRARKLFFSFLKAVGIVEEESHGNLLDVR